jgi:hypothetical protein
MSYLGYISRPENALPRNLFHSTLAFRANIIGLTFSISGKSPRRHVFLGLGVNLAYELGMQPDLNRPFELALQDQRELLYVGRITISLSQG